MQLRIVCVAGSRPEIVVKTFLAEYDVWIMLCISHNPQIEPKQSVYVPVKTQILHKTWQLKNKQRVRTALKQDATSVLTKPGSVPQFLKPDVTN